MNFIFFFLCCFSLTINLVQTDNCCTQCTFGTYNSVDIATYNGACNYYSQYGYLYNITEYTYLLINIYDDYTFIPSSYSISFSIESKNEGPYVFSYFDITNGNNIVAPYRNMNNIKYSTTYDNYLLQIDFLLQSNHTIYNKFKNTLSQLQVTFYCRNTEIDCDMDFKFQLY